MTNNERPGFAPPESDSDDGNEESSSSKKKRAGFRAPIISEKESKDAKRAEPKEERLKSLDEILGIEKGDAEDKDKQPAADEDGAAEKHKDKKPSEEVESGEVDDDAAEEPVEEERFEQRELAPDELHAGEVIIKLDDDVAEYVVPLHELPAEDNKKAALERARPKSARAEAPDRVGSEPAVEPSAQEEPEVQAVIPESPATVAHGAEAVPSERSAEAASAQATASEAAWIPLSETVESAAYDAAPRTETPEGLSHSVEPAPAPPDARPVFERPMSLDPDAMRQFEAPGVNPNTPTVGASPEERMAAKREMDDALYHAEKVGVSRGLVTGLLVGGGYEHIKHKRREKKQAKAFDRQRKQQRTLESNQQALRQELTDQRSASQRERRDLTRQLERSRYQAHHPEAGKVWRDASRPEIGVAPRPASPLETRPAQQTANYQESDPVRQEASRLAAEADRLQLENKPNGKRPQPELVPPEQVDLPPDRRVQTSAWHRIEVDAKTGKLVEQPTLSYGHEYYHERQHEAMPQPGQGAKEAAGEVALVADALHKSTPDNPVSTQTMPLQDVPDASTHQKLNPTVLPTKTKQTHQQSTQATGPLWPYVVILLVIIIAIIFALR